MAPGARFWLVLGILMLVAACSQPSRSFAVVGVAEARELLAQGQLTLVDAVPESPPWPEPLPGAVRWRVPDYVPPQPPELPEAGVLVIGASAKLAYRSAAALVRSGNRPVYLCIPTDVDERSSLHSVALQAKENSRGEDS